ncbi:hypothetical protein [Pseudomonas phage BILI]
MPRRAAIRRGSLHTAHDLRMVCGPSPLRPGALGLRKCAWVHARRSKEVKRWSKPRGAGVPAFCT